MSSTGRSAPSAPNTLANDRYEVLETLGSGGMGIVVRARDRQLRRDVAVKLLADNLAMDDDARERFDREARAAARLNHPNVVQVFDVGEQDGRPYFVMELIEGPTLSDRLLDAEGVTADELIRIARQSLDALEHAHDAGLIHRDIKPGNLMVADGDTLKITDFGVAEVAEVEGLTRTGHVLGTMAYLAPERLRGAPASPATDLYALGATLHELASGTPPKNGGALPEELPESLRALIQQCLIEDPSERPASVAEARHILEGGGATRVLTVENKSSVPETRPMVADGHDSGDVESRGADAGVVDPDAPTVDGPVSTPARLWQRLDGRAVAIMLILLVLVAWALTAGGGASEPTEQPTTQTTAETQTAPPIETGEDPASTARNIADWIRDNSGDG